MGEYTEIPAAAFVAATLFADAAVVSKDLLFPSIAFPTLYSVFPEYVSVISQVLTNNNNLNNNRGEEAANIGNLAFQNPFLGLGQLFLNSLINDN